MKMKNDEGKGLNKEEGEEKEVVNVTMGTLGKHEKESRKSTMFRK